MLIAEINPIKEKLNTLPNVSSKIGVAEDQGMQQLLSEIQLLRAEVNDLKERNLDLVKSCQTVKTSESNTDRCKDSNHIPTYANKVSSQPSKVIIRPKKPDQSLSQTKSDVVKNVNLVDENIIINTVKPVSSGGILVECSNQSCGDKLKQLASASLSNTYEVKLVRTFRPSVRIVGMSKDVTKESLPNYLLKQNPGIFSSSSWCRVLRYWSTFKDKSVFQADIEIDTCVYEKLIESGHVIVGVSGCKIFDMVSVPRCYKCNGFFHNAKQCKGVISCPLCAGAHPVNKCSIKEDETIERRCNNCLSLKNSLESISDFRNVDINHAAWEYAKCESYKLAVAKFKSSYFKSSKN
ncbi:hypothetical protein Zmor_018558 [Zophobas morio]|uniref:Nucleic-acid-binding protein from mobile element jockey n=1 Tax=Zophobas morio TaxID=2755281 RepID=A0AA38IAT3_9CUCU|nr:hypothetical protein Zmor_018558 [Zophobas morio]